MGGISSLLCYTDIQLPPLSEGPIVIAKPFSQNELIVMNSVKEYASEPQLLQLSLNSSNITNEVLKDILPIIEKVNFEKQKQKQEPRQLKIWLVGNNISIPGCEALPKASLLNLHELNISKNNIGDQGCLNLVKCNWPTLSSLALDENHIGERGAKYLSQGQWPLLFGIFMCENNLGQKGVIHLSKARWPQLNWFIVANNRIVDKGCKEVMKGSWINLKSLVVNTNRLNNKGCHELLKGNFRHLQWISADNNQITEFSMIFLREKYPKCFKMEYENQEDSFW